MLIARLTSCCVKLYQGIFFSTPPPPPPHDPFNISLMLSEITNTLLANMDQILAELGRIMLSISVEGRVFSKYMEVLLFVIVVTFDNDVNYARFIFAH